MQSNAQRIIRRFAYLPVMCNNGSWVWLGWYQTIEYYHQGKWRGTYFTEKL